VSSLVLRLYRLITLISFHDIGTIPTSLLAYAFIADIAQEYPVSVLERITKLVAAAVA
jgi:hypothetical protein